MNIITISTVERNRNKFHIEESNFPTTDYFKMSVQETIELSGYYDLVKTSFSRYYNAIHPSLKKSLPKIHGGHYFNRNFYELEINVIDRITFLFYYYLVQSILVSGYAMKIIVEMWTDNKSKKMSNKEKNELFLKLSKEDMIEMIDSDIKLSLEIPKKKRSILKMINSNEIITKVIQDNLKNLQEYKSNDNEFQNISQMFLKN